MISNRVRIGFMYVFTACFVVIFERIRFGVPPALFFVRGSDSSRCSRFLVLLFKLVADSRALLRQNDGHVVNLIMRAHTIRNPTIGSSASHRGFMFEGQSDEDHFLVFVEHDDVQNGG